MMIEIDGKVLNPKYIITAEVETRHYVNMSASYLVVKMAGGTTIRKEHQLGGFDAFKTLDRIKQEMQQ